MIALLLLLLIAAQTQGPPVPTPISPPIGAVIQQNTASCRGFRIRFEWSVPEPRDIFEYQIKILGPGMRDYAVDRLVPGRSFLWNSCEIGITDQNLSGWTWRVRARDRERQWGFWTPAILFHFAHAGK